MEKRFPRATLFARAAALQQQVEYWLGETGLQIQAREESNGPPSALDLRLLARQDYLEGARAAITECRTKLYDCP